MAVLQMLLEKRDSRGQQAFFNSNTNLEWPYYTENSGKVFPFSDENS
uniref:Uncharacterized protein n=1 Tax=Salvator merianae TaxID=96440 RepID=A0A8D0E044_SALMN